MMELSSVKSLLFVVLVFGTVFGTKERPYETYDMLYTKAVRAYNDKRWFECKQNIQHALADYKWYQDSVSYCRIKCAKQSDSSVYQKELNRLHFFEAILGQSDCIRRCKQKQLKGRPEGVSKSILKDFEGRKPYDYLQFCAYKNDDVDLAVASVYTYMLKHPDDKASKDNIEFYQKLPGVTQDSFKNLELLDHQDYYMKGIQFYNEEEFVKSLETMEKALMLYHQAYDRCSALCEEPYDHESLPEFYIAIADHFIRVLECQHKCTRILATPFHKEEPNYYEEHYNYLQYSYHRLGNMKKAAEAAGTYLLFKPNDDEMLKNKEYYLTHEHVSEDDMKPRVKAKLFHQRLKEESRLLKFIRNEYMSADDVEETLQDKKKAKSLFGDKDHSYRHGLEMYRDEHDLTLVMDESDLGESDRFLVAGFLNKDECQQLAQLAQVTEEGSKKAEQLTFSRVIQMVKNSTASEKVANLLLTVTKNSKEYLSQHLNILRNLYFEFAELVCSSADSDTWSHDVRADNCEVEENGKCAQYNPIQAYSAVLFLTSSQTGGKYYFENDEAYLDKDIPVQCGHLLGYKSNSWYGVRKLEEGTVCALKMSFTLQKKHEDLSYDIAVDNLAALKTKRRFLENPALKEMLSEKKIEIKMAEDDLNGTERFAATEVLSSEECLALIKLANAGAIAGDGYSAGGVRESSPHTKNEMFEGLTVMRAAQLAAAHKIDVESAKLYLSIAEKARSLTETYFDLETPLYFDYTHLVCRTAIDDKNKDRDDLSHPIHSDNCHIQDDGSCPRRPPAYAERDYSSLIYLNGDFDGGQFFFADKNLSVQAELQPKCGMMVAFNAGNYHGVKAVLSGQRCAVALWYTLDPRYKEEAHIIARDIIDKVEKPQGPNDHGEL